MPTPQGHCADCRTKSSGHGMRTLAEYTLNKRRVLSQANSSSFLESLSCTWTMRKWTAFSRSAAGRLWGRISNPGPRGAHPPPLLPALPEQPCRSREGPDSAWPGFPRCAHDTQSHAGVNKEGFVQSSRSTLKGYTQPSYNPGVRFHDTKREKKQP